MSLILFTNGFWPGFATKKDGTHVGFFEYILGAVSGKQIMSTDNPNDIEHADILLESHFMNKSPSYIHAKKWKLTLFFSGEVIHPYPAHHLEYDIVLGTNESEINRIGCPLYILYQFCKPEYVHKVDKPVSAVPSGNVCAIIRQCHENSFRNFFIDTLMRYGIDVDMGGLYRNNTGHIISGDWHSPALQDFQAQYKCILALENGVDEYYISEKIINPLYAGVVPIYYGCPRVGSYINEKRIICVSESNYMDAIEEIQKLLLDNNKFLEMVRQPVFIRPYTDIIDDIIARIRSRIATISL